MPIMPVPVSKSQEYELQKDTDEGNSNAELNAERGAPCEKHAPYNYRGEGEHEDPHDPKDGQEVNLI